MDQTFCHGSFSFGQPIPNSRLSRPTNSGRQTAGSALTATAIPSEQLSVHGAIAGLALNATRVQSHMKKHHTELAATRAPINQLLEQLSMFNVSVGLLQKHLATIRNVSMQISERTTLIELDTLIASLTACVMAFSDLADRLEEDNVEQAEQSGCDDTKCHSHCFLRVLQKDVNRISILEYQMTGLCNALRR